MNSAIDTIISTATQKEEKHNLYLIEEGACPVIVKLIKQEDGSYFHSIQYKRSTKHDKGWLFEMLWSIMDAEEFVSKFILGHSFKVSILSKRSFGEEKMSKPKELKGKKADFSVYFNKKCSFPCFRDSDKLYIQCKDYFSEVFRPPVEDMDKPLGFLMKKYFNKDRGEKFIYPDCWGSIILRNEAWLLCENIGFLDTHKRFVDKRACVEEAFRKCFREDRKLYNYDDTDWNLCIEQIAENIIKI